MNKQTINKLSLFLKGFSKRYEENNDFFINISFVFKSSGKEFKGICETVDKKFILNFYGNNSFNTLQEVFDKLCEYAINYDTLNIDYIERGYKIFITCDGKNVKIKNEEIKDESNEDFSILSNRDYIIKSGSAKDLLIAIDIMTKDGKIKNDKIRKYNQIDHYLEVIQDCLDEIPKNKRINILDCGCGKSYLSFALNYYLTEIKKLKVNFIGIDVSKKVIDSSIKIAKDLNYKNMEFIQTDIKDFHPNIDIYMVISLHACDTATDMALSFGVLNDAKIIISNPCCHKEMLSQYSYEPFNEILKHGILKARIADFLTDGMRALLLEGYGYDVSVLEYISPLETPKNVLIKAVKRHEKNESYINKYRELMNALNIYPAFYDYLNN
ncbi:MAG: SAM-dependent methyltransferase [Oscillospiraceae bacterium]|nr:SAM-dependent methyltransferase [Oscillospiraceae bacterium]